MPVVPALYFELASVERGPDIKALLPFLDEAVAEGLITIEAVRVLRYRHNEAKGRS